MNNNLKAKCRFKNGLLDGKRYNGTVYKIKSFIWVKQDDRLALIEVLDQNGPVSVSIEIDWATDLITVTVHLDISSSISVIFCKKPSHQNYMTVIKNMKFILSIFYSMSLKTCFKLILPTQKPRNLGKFNRKILKSSFFLSLK